MSCTMERSSSTVEFAPAILRPVLEARGEVPLWDSTVCAFQYLHHCKGPAAMSGPHYYKGRRLRGTGILHGIGPKNVRTSPSLACGSLDVW
jgi:hypothetical protein